MDNSGPNKRCHNYTSHAYLVRLWRDSPVEPWRASAKRVADGRELHFANLEKLFLFLYKQTSEKGERQGAKDES
jgi:hypothetical protein